MNQLDQLKELTRINKELQTIVTALQKRVKARRAEIENEDVQPTIASRYQHEEEGKPHAWELMPPDSRRNKEMIFNAAFPVLRSQTGAKEFKPMSVNGVLLLPRGDN